MIYRPVALMFSALMMVGGVAAVAGPDAEESGQVESDLTGYWQREDGAVFHFVQEGVGLISRHDRQPAHAEENDLDFTATIYGKLIYGAHRGPFSRAMQKKCAIQIWVGMGLTLSDDGRLLEGFRGDRIVDAKRCSTRNSDPVRLVYKRLPDYDPPQ